MFMVMHPECGAPAFYLLENPPPGAHLDSSIVVLPNGEKIAPFSHVHCFFCKEVFMPRRELIVPMPKVPT